MRTGSSDILSRGHRGWNRLDARLTNGRKSRYRWIDLEGLESRTLLATIPAATPTAAPQNISSLFGNIGGLTTSENSSVVAVDPLNPQKMVSAWVDNDPALLGITDNIIAVIVEAAYSTNAGQVWHPFQGEPGNDLSIPVSTEVLDPTTSGPTVPYKYDTEPSLGFDASGNFYLLSTYSNGPDFSSSSSGALVLQKYDFTGNAPVQLGFPTDQTAPAYNEFFGALGAINILYGWSSSSSDDTITHPTMQVDSNLPSFTDPTTGQVQTDPYSGDIYVSWSGIDVKPSLFLPVSLFNPNRIKLIVSSDGGNNFTSETIASVNSLNPDNDNGPTTERNTTPALTVSQGRLPSESGEGGDAGIPGGQVAVSWEDFADVQLMANTVSAGRGYVFGGDAGNIPFGTTTEFGNSVQFPANFDFSTLTNLSVTVAIVDSSDANLGLTLVAPSGDTLTLFLPQTINGVTNTGRGIGGANVGTITYTMNNIATYALGTTFDDNATRSIFDPTTTGTNANTAPYLGNFRIEGSGFGGGFNSLTSFLDQEIAKGINGSWKLETIETSTSAPATPSFINYWTLNFTQGLSANIDDVVVPGTKGLIVPGSITNTYSTASAAVPNGIGPGIVMAQDNTLGSFSPYQGRIYTAFVGYYDVTVFGVKNPTDNTDIFLTYSDDGGRSWTTPEQVNDDDSLTDGYTESNDDPAPQDEITGRVQYQPEIAVDPVTGTLVMSWRDGRDNPARDLVATYITTSIDGGNTFSVQDYANPEQTATDAITGQTDVMGPEADNESSNNSNRDGTYGYGTSMGLAVYDGQVYPMWAGDFNQASIVNNAIQGDPLSIYFRPMVIAAGPRILTSTMGPIPLSEAESGRVSFTVTYDRPINPPSGTATFTTNDVQVFYHDTTDGDASIPLQLLSVTPVASSGVGPDNKFGYTEFTVTFNPNARPDDSASGITNFTGTYSYLIAPDDGNGNAIASPIPSYVITPVVQPVVGPVQSTDVPLRIPTEGTGGTGTTDDITTSTITLAGDANQLITGITIGLTLNHQRASDLTITLVAPDGRSTVIFQGTSNGSLNFVNQQFAVNDLNNGPVDGTYKLVIDDGASNNTGTLTAWSITVNSELPTYGLQTGAPDDQNADGTADQNAVTTPYTGLTPGDVYAVPTPQPTTAVTFFGAASILSPPFNQNTLPLIVPGPQVLSTSVPGGDSANGNLITDGTTSSLNVTFDRPMQVSTFTPAQVLSIMGPTGLLSGPQYFPSSSSTGQIIPGATSSTSPGVLDATLNVPSYGGTFKIAQITVELNAAFSPDSGLTAVLIAPDGTQVPLFSGVGGTGSNFINTVFDDTAENSITTGTAPFTGTYRPTGTLSTLDGHTVDMQNSFGQWISGTWTLQLTNKSGSTGMLDNWSLNVTPVITVTPVSPVNGTATTFTIGFPQQQLSGTYTIQLGPNILDTFGDALDTNQNAGLAVLRDQGQNSPTTTVKYTAADLPKAIRAPIGTTAGQVTSTIAVPDSFIIQGDTTSTGVSGLQVQINLTYPTDPDLTATLYHYDLNGDLLGQVTLFSNVGQGTRTANFTNTVFDDNATTPIQNGSAPFFATFNPQQSLATAFAGMSAQGTWTLVIQNASTTGGTGTFNSWSLTFQKSLPTSGLGEPGSDDVTASFRIFTLSQADALSSQQWTAVGPASISGIGAGRIGGLAIDPSDPSGNTVYVAGASGGIWKTTDFLTTNPAGPTYIPLTNFGPTFGVNIGSIAVFGRNHDPNQSIIIAATGEGDTGTPGVGFLISMDGGATWNLYDSLNNVDSSGNLLPIESAARDRAFVGMTSYKVVVDPQLTPSGQVIIYAAMSGPNGGIYRSENTGKTWQLMLAGQATDVVLDADSGAALNPVTGTIGQGNLQVVYAGIRGVGVYMSPNQGQVWNLMTGGIGNPLIVDVHTGKNTNPVAGLTPNGAEGRIVLAVPTPTGNAAEDAVYAGWLYAAVAAPNGSLYGLFVTKDFGQNWTQVRIPSLPPLTSGGIAFRQAIATNNVSEPDYNILGNQGNYDITLAVDPTNPNITYLGGQLSFGQTGLIRIDATTLWDAHSLVAYSNQSQSGAVNLNSTGPAAVDSNLLGLFPGSSYLNYIRSPQDPFEAGATLPVFNYASFTNNGAGVEWIPFDMGGTDYHRVVTMIDPTTGLPRLIFGNDQGVWTVLDDNGTFESQIGSSDSLATINRDGNLQITQFYYGAAQPSSAAAQVAGALFYGSAQDDGGPASDPNILTNGNSQWSYPYLIYGDATGVATDQQGLGTLYQYWWPCCGGDYTDFFQVDDTGRTSGLLQASGGLPTPDPQWPFTGGANFAVNQVNGQDVVISSATGNIFATTNEGVSWFDIGEPAVFGSPGSFSDALAYGAPDPTAPEGVGNLGNFIYVGTAKGQIYVTQDGGGSGASNNWLNISLGLSGGAVESITTDPIRGTHDAYAVTSAGVFYIKDSIALANNPTDVADEWVNITNNIHNLPYTIFSQSYNPTTDPNDIKLNQAMSLSSIVADWRYMIPNESTDPAGPGYHPVLYVGSNSGVYQSTDDGLTWTLFPDTTYSAMIADGAIAEGGNLPHVSVTSLSLSLGNIDSNTGIPTLAGPYQTFVFSGTLSSGSESVTGISNLTGLVVGESITGIGIPAGTTIQAVSSSTSTITLSANATASGSQTLAAANATTTPDPDLLMAATYGQGEFAINLPPLILGNAVTVTPTSGTGSVPTVTGPVTISGSSEISGFGDTTWITIEDVTNPANPVVIAGFNPKNGAAVPSSSNSTNALGNFSIPFDPASYYTSNGPKTIEIFATDNAGSVGNVVTYSFMLKESLPPPPPTSPPTFSQNLALLPADIKSAPGVNPPVTNLTQPVLTGATNPGVTITVSEFEEVNGSFVAFGPSYVLTSGVNADGSFSFPFLNPNPSSSPPPVLNGTFQVYVTAQYTQYPGLGTTTSNTVTFKIDNTTPGPVTDFRLNPADDTGIQGDNITSDRAPQFIGTAPAGDTIELFQLISFTGTLTSGSASVTGVSSTTGLAAGQAVTGTGIPSKTTILSVSSSTDTITLSANATGTGPQSLTAMVPVVQNTTIAQPMSTNDANGKPYDFSINLPFNLTNGQIGLGVVVLDVFSGNASPVSSPVTVTIVSVTSDYNGDSYSDAALYSRNTTANTGTWLVQNTTLVPATPLPPPFWFTSGTAFGPARVTPFQGDFDGDGLSDLAYYQSSNETWYMYDSQTKTMSSFAITGATTSSIPVVGYFDANAPEEVGVYTFANGVGTFTVTDATHGLRTVTFPSAQAGDIPVPGSYNGIGPNSPGHDQFALYRPNNGNFYVLQANGTFTTLNLGVGSSPDLSSLVPVPGNYNPYLNTSVSPAVWVEDTEAAVFDPNTGVYTILGPSGVYTVGGFEKGDIPAPADYAGNGSTQPVVFRPSTGQFLEFITVNGKPTLTAIATFGQASADIPLAAPLSYRTPPSAPSSPPSPPLPPSTGTGTGTGTTGTGTGTGTGTTGTGTGTTGTGTGTTGTGTGTGTGTTGGTGTGGSSTGAKPPTAPGSGAHKTPKPPVHHSKKPPVHVKPKKVQHAAPEPKVHVVSHPAKKVVKVVTASSTLAKKPVHVVDLALEHVHVNLRRSSLGNHG